MSEKDNGIPKIEVEVSIAAKDAFEHLLCYGGVNVAISIVHLERGFSHLFRSQKVAEAVD
jgi:hypothetical protein